jgi:hypothetical protein
VSAGAIDSAAEDQFAADQSFYATRLFDMIEAAAFACPQWVESGH